jgi:hypothetical protein
MVDCKVIDGSRSDHSVHPSGLVNIFLSSGLRGKFSCLSAKFFRLLISFGGAVWGLRSCLHWMKSGSELGAILGPLLFLAISLALAKIVDEEARRDLLRERAQAENVKPDEAEPVTFGQVRTFMRHR